MRQDKQKKNRHAAVVAGTALALVLSSAGLALILDTTVEGQSEGPNGEDDQGGTSTGIGDDGRHRDDLIVMDHANLEHGSAAAIDDARLQDSYVHNVTFSRSAIEDSRIENSTIRFSSVENATLCDTTLTGGVGPADDTLNSTTNITDGVSFSNCTAATLNDGKVEVHAVIEQDAPEVVRPGESYDIRINGSDAEELIVHNDPGGLIGLGLDPEADPLRLHEHGFAAIADNDSVAMLQLWMPPMENATDNVTDNATDGTGNETGNVTDGGTGNETGNVTDGTGNETGNMTDGTGNETGNMTDGTGNETGNMTDNATGNATLLANFTFGEAVDLPDGPFILRVITNNTSIIDHTRIGLLLELDGHAVRPEMTSFEVVATELVIPPVEAQLFAPFLADDVARLVLSQPIDDHGNVDRDVNISFAVTVNSVNATDATLVGDLQRHARLHDDSRLFSDAPFSYGSEVPAAHHPQTLELLVRLNLDNETSYGDINAYGTHLVAIGPYETNVTLSASATNATGASLSSSIDIVMGAAPDAASSVEAFGQSFPMPGRGTLNVSFVNDTGEPVNATGDWALAIEETPSSHGVAQSIRIEENATSVEQALASSTLAGTPFGNFLSSAYRICVDHDGTRDCAAGDELTPITTGQTTAIEIVIS